MEQVYDPKDEMYCNDNVILNFKMPRTLQNLVKEADEFFEQNDWFWYDIRVSEIESTTKQELLCGLITQEMFHRIWERYGIG